MQSIWQVGLIALAAGGLIGALAYRLLAPSLTKADQVRSELEAARQELIDYKASVNSHFDKTSELVNDLTQNYVKVYQHLAEGAQTLGDSRQLNNLLEQQQGKVLLTVDDQAQVSKAQDDNRRMEASGATDETVAGAEDTEAAKEPGVEASSESASGEPAAAATESDAIDKSPPKHGKAEAAASDGVEKPKAAGPRIDVTRIKQTAADDGESETDLGTLISDADKSRDEVKPTRH